MIDNDDTMNSIPTISGQSKLLSPLDSLD